MNQSLEVNLTIPIPEGSILIRKVELEELQSQTLTGVYWNMKDLQKRINKSDKWIKENILYKQRFRDKLDSVNGGPVYYPQSQGQSWSFQASEMSKFLDKSFSRIFGG